MTLIISLRKENVTAEQAQQLIDIVKGKLADHPSIKISAQISERLEPPPG